MREPARHSRRIVVGGLIALIGVLVLGAVGYWYYIHDVPPFVPTQSPLPKPNGYERAAALALRLPSTPSTIGWPIRTSGQLPAQLAPLRPLLNGVRVTFRLGWRKPLPQSLNQAASSSEFKPLSSFRNCARWFGAESVLASTQGDPGMGMQRALDAMELGSKMVRGGGHTHWLAGLACHAIGFAQAEQSVPPLPASAIPAALARIRAVKSGWPPVSELLETERISTHLLLTEAFIKREGEGLLSWEDTKPTFWESVGLQLTPRRNVVVNMDDYYRDLIAESRKPVWQRAPVSTPSDPWSKRLLPLLTYDLNNWWRLERPQTDLALLEVALAVRMHRLEYGRYPTRLGEIGHQWLPMIPVDLWGQPIAYRLTDGKPVIYSFGPDGKDDGGDAANPTWLAPTTRGDLVFGKLSSTVWSSRRFGAQWGRKMSRPGLRRGSAGGR